MTNAAYPVTFEFRPTDGSAPFSVTKTLSASGSFSIADIPAKIYNLWIKGPKWLAKVVAVDGTIDNKVNVFTTLATGDVNNDNSVDVFDFAAFVSAFGSSTGDTFFDAGADLNGDGTADALDFALLVSNFDMAGAP